MKHFLHSTVDIPSPPAWMISESLRLITTDVQRQAEMNNWGADFTQRTLYHPTGNSINSFNHGIFLDEKSVVWAHSNVTDDMLDIRVSYTDPHHPRCGSHTDRTRTYTLIYLLETGGPDHQTVFYRETGCDDLVRPPAHRVDHYDQLTTISSVRLSVGSWSLLNGRILHSIENISEGRVSIQIGFDAFPQHLSLIGPVYIDA